jgi:hypothetical protein
MPTDISNDATQISDQFDVSETEHAQIAMWANAADNNRHAGPRERGREISDDGVIFLSEIEAMARGNIISQAPDEISDS